MKDEGKLEGKWAQIYSNEDGFDNPDDDKGLGSITEFGGGRFTVCSQEGVVVLEGKYKIRSNINPPEIDWVDTMGVDEGKTFMSIYKLTSDIFIFCAADEGMVRPKTFEPQKGHTIRKFSKLNSNA